jgi:hypothetical protein
MPELAPAAGGLLEHTHAGECPACAARLRRQGELSLGLRTLAEGSRRYAAPPRVEARLVAAYRTHTGAAPAAGPRRRWIPALTWAAAFAAMIAMAFFLVRGREPEASRPAPPRGVELAMLEGGALLEATDMDAAREEGFIPLPAAAHLAPAEAMNLVRVELPRSSMIALGFEVSPEQAAETVQADVMLDADGIARAVRFDVSGSDF